MNGKRLTRRLRRELTGNPKKAAVLGLLILVALYFWAPLLWDWIAGGGSKAKATPAANTAEGIPPVLAGLVPSASAPATAAGKAKRDEKQSAGHPWSQVIEWIEQDPRMTPAGELPSSRDPFHPVEQEVAKTPTSEEIKAAEAAAAVTPESLGLVLNSTLIGPHRRTALVNGRAYEQGRTIELARDGRRVEYTLSEVHPRRIVLKREGKTYELTIPQPASSGRLEVYGSTN